MGLKISAGLGLALVILAGAFKMYYDKTQAEIESFHLQLERSIQNQKTLESTIKQQNENLRQTVENQELMVAQVEKLTKENMVAQNEVTDIRKKVRKAQSRCSFLEEAQANREYSEPWHKGRGSGI